MKHGLNEISHSDDPHSITMIKCNYCNTSSIDLKQHRIHFYKNFNDCDTRSCFYKNCKYSSKSLGNYKSHHSKEHKDATINDVNEIYIEISQLNHSSCNELAATFENDFYIRENEAISCETLNDHPHSLEDYAKSNENSLEIDLRFLSQNY
jgi:hypothetical protein